MKTALIAGATGQDRAYLARMLLRKNYIAHGVKPWSSRFNTQGVDGIYADPYPSAGHEAIRVLDHRELSGSVWHLRVERHSFQSRIPHSGRDFSYPQDYHGRSADRRSSNETLYLGNPDAKRDWASLVISSKGRGKYCKPTGPMFMCSPPANHIPYASSTSPNSPGWDSSLNSTESGAQEIGREAVSGRTLVEVDPRYFRPTEVDTLVGGYSKAGKKLRWKPRVSFQGFIEMMADADLAAVQKGVPFTLDPSFESLRSVVE